jgi:subtilase family serine protease
MILGWQAGVATSSNGGSSKLRNVPDVAMEADFDNYACGMGQCGGGWAGTSFAAPRWAGFMALVNQQAQIAGDPSLGFLNPTLYAIGKGPSYSTDFHDITSGNNNYLQHAQQASFYALPDYDLVTGWGSPAGQNLIDAERVNKFETGCVRV